MMMMITPQRVAVQAVAPPRPPHDVDMCCASLRSFDGGPDVVSVADPTPVLVLCPRCSGCRDVVRHHRPWMTIPLVCRRVSLSVSVPLLVYSGTRSSPAVRTGTATAPVLFSDGW